jgi:RNA recognition motif-containing protein
MPQLLLSNVPWNCKESELREWVTSYGFSVDSVRLVRDLVTNGSPAFAYVQLNDSNHNALAIDKLNRRVLNGNVVQVQEEWQSSSSQFERRRTR